MFCQNCGSKLEDSAKFCSNCGKKVETDFPVNVKTEVAAVSETVMNTEAAEAVTEKASDIGSNFVNEAAEAVTEVSEKAEGAEKAASEAVENIPDADEIKEIVIEKAEEKVEEKIDVIEETVEEKVDEVEEKAEEKAEEAKTEAEEKADAVSDIASVGVTAAADVLNGNAGQNAEAPAARPEYAQPQSQPQYGQYAPNGTQQYGRPQQPGYGQQYAQPQPQYGQQYGQYTPNGTQQYGRPQQPGYGQQYAQPQPQYGQQYGQYAPNGTQQYGTQQYGRPQQPGYGQQYAQPQPQYGQQYGQYVPNGTQQYGGPQQPVYGQQYAQPQPQYGQQYAQPRQERPQYTGPKKGMIWHNIYTYPILIITLIVLAFYTVFSYYGASAIEYYMIEGMADFEDLIENSNDVAEAIYIFDDNTAAADIMARALSGVLVIWGIVTLILLILQKRAAIGNVIGFNILLILVNLGYALFRFLDIGFDVIFEDFMDFITDFQFAVYGVFAIVLLIVNCIYYSKRKNQLR